MKSKIALTVVGSCFLIFVTVLEYFPNTLNLPENSFTSAIRGLLNSKQISSDKMLSTLANILNRYGDENNLIPYLADNVLSVRHPNVFSPNASSNPWHMSYLERHKFDFCVQHIHWDRSLYSNLLGPDAKYLTIIRDPVKMFESFFGYSIQRRDSEDKRSLKEFIQSKISDGGQRSFDPQLTFNRMSNRLNIMRRIISYQETSRKNGTFSTDEAMIKDAVAKFDEEMDFVAILEYFQESMVLLSQSFCIPLRFMTSIPKKQRIQKFRNELSPDVENLLKEHQVTDHLLYEHFVKQHQEKAKEFGLAKLKRFVGQLEQMNDYVLRKCKIREVEKEGTITTVARRQTMECQTYTYDVGEYGSAFRQKLRKRWIRERSK